MGIFKKVQDGIDQLQTGGVQIGKGISKVVRHYGKVDKMLIKAYKCIEKVGDKKALIDEFEVQFNPTNYKESYSNYFADNGAAGDQNRPVYINSVSDKMSFTFLLDGTLFDNDFITSNDIFDFEDGNKTNNSTQKQIKASSVYAAIEKFKRLTMNVDDVNSNQPNALELMWGKLRWQGYMKSVSVSHELFDTTGVPIRSKLTCEFIEHRSFAAEKKKDDKGSKDVSAVHTVKDGDTLPGIASEYYQDPSLFLQIAEVNNIANPRSLTVGTELTLPPLNLI